MCKTKGKKAILRGMPRFLDWYLYVPSRSCPLFQEKGDTANCSGALVPPGCSALCYMEFKKVSLALPEDLHLLVYLLSPFLETVCGKTSRGMSRYGSVETLQGF